MKFKSLMLLGGLALAAMPVVAQNDDTVNVRLVNALPQSQGISVTVGGTQLFQNVQSNDITPYKPMPKQDDQTIVIQNGSQQLQTTEKLDFDDDDENYTILITPDQDNNNPKVVVLDSDRENVDSDEVEINVINASPAHKSVKLRLNDDVIERGINYADSGDTDDAKPGVYTLALLDSSGDDTVIATRSVTLTGGTAVTVLLTGQNQVKIINDQSPQTELSEGGSASGAAPANRTTTGTQTPASGAMTPASGSQTPASGAQTQAPSTRTTPALSF